PEPTVSGQVLYRAGRGHELRPDRGARVLLLRGEETLALKAAGQLREFEQRYPEGLRRAKDRPVEEATRKAAMVLQTYEKVHAEAVAAAADAGPDGTFRLSAAAPGRYTLLIESGAAFGSYHLKRYDARVVTLGEPMIEPVRVDFGVSHLEHHHPAAPRRPASR